MSIMHIYFQRVRFNTHEFPIALKRPRKVNTEYSQISDSHKYVCTNFPWRLSLITDKIDSSN